MSLGVTLTAVKPTCVFDANITHNLGKMAIEAGIYEQVWQPEQCGVKLAGALIGPLTTAIADMKARPLHYKKFDSSNGWGIYDDFLPWLERYLQACCENPDAEISASRCRD